jgi:hypothetical protein
VEEIHATNYLKGSGKQEPLIIPDAFARPLDGNFSTVYVDSTRLWDLSTMESLGDLMCHRRIVAPVALSPPNSLQVQRYSGIPWYKIRKKPVTRRNLA